MEETIMTGETYYVNQAESFKRNDIVVFNYWGEDYSSPPKEPGKFIMRLLKKVYRLIAISGDSLFIKDADVYIDGKYITPPPKSLFDYEVVSSVSIDDFPERRGEPVQPFAIKGDTLHYLVQLTTEQASDYRRRAPAVLSVKKHFTEYDSGDTFLIRPCGACNWTVDRFGPLYIPAVGDTILVDSINFKLYHNIPGIHPGKNIIKEKLYFVLGDNRHGAEDSRYIGFISHSKMYGIVK
jgi:signal peptidase I